MKITQNQPVTIDSVGITPSQGNAPTLHSADVHTSEGSFTLRLGSPTHRAQIKALLVDSPKGNLSIAQPAFAPSTGAQKLAAKAMLSALIIP